MESNYALMVLKRELESRQRKLEDTARLYLANPKTLIDAYVIDARSVTDLDEAIKELERPKLTVVNGGVREPRTNSILRDSGGDRD